MAGKLKPEEVRSVMEALSGVNRSLASCLESLGESQKRLEKSIKCQAYLNHESWVTTIMSLKPVQTGFVLKENIHSDSEAGERV